MTLLKRYNGLIKQVMSEPDPEIRTELHYINGFQLLVAVVLSAQCTDKRVNLVTPAFFNAFPSAEHLASSAFEEVFPYLKSISYPNNKTKYLIAAAKQLVEKFQGEIPNDLSTLQNLPGVGRKSAHAIGAILYDIPAWAVDTHVMRVSRRIGLLSDKIKSPLAIEKELLKHIPVSYINRTNHWLIIHGRYTCIARKPKCASCKLTDYCLYFKEMLEKN